MAMQRHFKFSPSCGDQVAEKMANASSEAQSPAKGAPPAPQAVHPFAKGDLVATMYGKGVVEEFRPASGVVVVMLTSWKLAGGSIVRCYLEQKTVVVETSC